MKHNQYQSSSRKRTPWDDKRSLSSFETFIQHEYKSHFYAHHGKLSQSQETTFLNSIPLSNCKYCNSTQIKKNGFTANGVQRYFCKMCNKRFTITKNTIFEHHRISITEWIEYCLNIFDYSSIHLDSKNNKNAFTTSKYWLAKIFLILSDYQKNVILRGEVEIDETYYTVICSELIKTKEGKLLRGLSNNKFCIGMGCDKKRVYAVLEGKAKPSDTKTKKAFLKHIEKGSILIHDEEKSHNILVKELALKSYSYNSKYLNDLPDNENPLKKINHYCYLLKMFLNAHSGFNRDELQDYLNLFCFMMNPPHNKLEKVKILLEMALNSSYSLTFRDYYLKRPSK